MPKDSIPRTDRLGATMMDLRPEPDPGRAASVQHPRLHERLATPFVVRMLLLSLAAVMLSKAVRYAGLLPAQDLTDFDAFHIAGRMVWRGDIAQAYHLPALLEVQRALTGDQAFLPWTYPPPFNLVVAALAPLPIGLAYLVFVGATLAAYLLVLRRIAGPHFATVVVALAPSLFVAVAGGQNGFLTGTLAGLTGLGLLRGRAWAGLPLGLMVIKPHLAVGLAVCALVMRRWGCLAVAAATAALALALSTAVLGPAIWPAFLGGVEEAKAFLAAGAYPLFRMVSVYAWLRSLDVPAAVALAAQMAIAVAVLGLIPLALRRGMPPRQIVGLAALASLFVSPYAYDYDLPLYGVALALLLPDLLGRASRGEEIALLGLGWMAGGYGFVAGGLHEALVGTRAASSVEIALAAPPFLLLLALIWRILRRERAAAMPGAAGSLAGPVGPVPA
ncbi:UNVERIFIED_CONTAM: glycosyltransferase family 87 protein [Methylobacteriaceae bacterium AG10]|nr:glycosyltransferase family 87 protein [Methylobacteriaceae bacterium AG10]